MKKRCTFKRLGRARVWRTIPPVRRDRRGNVIIYANLGIRHPDYGQSPAEHFANKAARKAAP